MPDKLCLIIPCYNEASRLSRERVKNASTANQIVLVNDGSTDTTRKVIKQIIADAGESSPSITLVDLPDNLGKGNAIREGILYALENSDAHYFGIVDADLSAPLSEIERFVDLAKSSNNLIIQGSRINLSPAAVGQPYIRRILGKIGSLMIAKILQLDINDTQA